MRIKKVKVRDLKLGDVLASGMVVQRIDGPHVYLSDGHGGAEHKRTYDPDEVVALFVDEDRED